MHQLVLIKHEGGSVAQFDVGTTIPYVIVYVKSIRAPLI